MRNTVHYLISLSYTSNALKRAQLLLNMKHGLARLDNVWGIGGGQRPVMFLVNKASEEVSCVYVCLCVCVCAHVCVCYVHMCLCVFIVYMCVCVFVCIFYSLSHFLIMRFFFAIMLSQMIVLLKEYLSSRDKQEVINP